MTGDDWIPWTFTRAPTAGEPSGAKREQVASMLRDAGQAACVLTDPPSINWLLNLRGGDVAYTPVALCFAILHADARTDLFIDPAKLDDAARAWRRDLITERSG